MRLLIAISVPVDCHMWASCLPHRCLLSATCGSHVGQTTATRGPHVGQRCKTCVAHMCALRGSHFNCHMWAVCGPLVECLLGCVSRMWRRFRLNMLPLGDCTLYDRGSGHSDTTLAGCQTHVVVSCTRTSCPGISRAKSVAPLRS